MGFNLLSGIHRLNSRLIPIHAGSFYVYRTHWVRYARNVGLQVVLRDGREVTLTIT